MKSQSPPIKGDPKSVKSSMRRLDLPDKRFSLQKKNANRWRIVQSVQAGHVRGGHGFH